MVYYVPQNLEAEEQQRALVVQCRDNKPSREDYEMALLNKLALLLERADKPQLELLNEFLTDPLEPVHRNRSGLSQAQELLDRDELIFLLDKLELKPQDKSNQANLKLLYRKSELRDLAQVL